MFILSVFYMARFCLPDQIEIPVGTDHNLFPYSICFVTVFLSA